LIPSPAAHLVMGGTLSLRERDARKHASNFGNELEPTLRLDFSVSELRNLDTAAWPGMLLKSPKQKGQRTSGSLAFALENWN